MAKRIVINTGPLIALACIDALEVVEKLPFEFICPHEVQIELDDGVAQGYAVICPAWLKVIPLTTPLNPIVLPALDIDEAAVIQLALDQHIPLVCIDEWKGRRAALAVGLKVTGTLGLLGRAKVLGIISALRPLVERSIREGIRYHPDLVRRVLESVGE